MKFILRLLFGLTLSVALAACSPVRFVPEGETMLSSVRVKSDTRQVAGGDYRVYIRQEPNSRWLSVAKVPMGIYCLSGADSTRRFNRFMHRIGEAPVIYDSTLTAYSQHAIEVALRSQGYLHARVNTETAVANRRTRLTYDFNCGPRYYIRSVDFSYDNDAVRREVESALDYRLHAGQPLVIEQLDEQRQEIVRHLRKRGYYNLTPEFITYEADTLAHDRGVALHFSMRTPAGAQPTIAYRQYRIGEVTVHEVPALPDGEEAPALTDTTYYHGLKVVRGPRGHLGRHVYRREVFLYTDSLYSDRTTQLTYQGLNSLPLVNYATVRYATPHEGDSLLTVDVMANLQQPNAVAFDLEGTNTAGDLGGAASMTYTNRNLFGGSESFSIKLRGAYEAIKHLEGYQNQNYLEYGAEGTLRLSSMPIVMSAERHAALKGGSELSVLYNSQDRPEFHRRLLTAAWSLNWLRRTMPNLRHRLDLISLNYVFMPWISETFTKDYLEGDDPRYAVLRYSYENLFIMKTGYSFIYNSLHGATTLNRTNGYQIKMGVEAAGNLLHAIASLSHMKPGTDGSYSLFNIPYSQYAKFDFDYSKSLAFTDRHSLAFHAALGVVIPYGNSTIVPYEKRYFAGGANSVRGWSVRQLGPGSYQGQDGNIDFINQTGNLKLDLSVEYRTPLFWKLEGAAFVDAGNIWNTRNYADQPGGQFRLDTFYKQIAVGYGIGLRLNFNYFILRLDGGMKAVNPVELSGPGHWPIIHPNLGRDFTLHFAVGLPF